MDKRLFVILLLLLTSCSKKYDVEYILPNGFQGKVGVFYEVPDGEDVIKKNDRLIFRIPESGILLTKAKNQGGPYVQYIYFDEKTDDKKNLKNFSEWRKLDSLKQKHLVTDTTIVTYNFEVAYYHLKNVSKPLKYKTFIVSAINNVDSVFYWNKKFRNVLDSYPFEY